MKRLFLLVCLSFAFLSFISAVETTDLMVVTADVVGDVIGIEVTNEVDFGEISKGSISSRQDINITNTGTINIKVTPEISEDYSGEIFNHLSFQRVLSDPKKKIGNFSIDIDKPSSSGGVRTQKVYMYLDLTEYSGDIVGDLEDHQTEVVFWATSN